MSTTVREFIYDEPSVPWVDQSIQYDTKGNLMKAPSFIRKLDDGLEGRPQGSSIRLPEGFLSESHFHTEAQFLVALEGSMEFPNHPVDAIGVHYTDASTAYGDFVCKTDFRLATLRPRKGSTSLHMVFPENRKVRDPYGREIMGNEKEVPWEDLKDVPGARRKVIFEGQGPAAQLLEYAPNTRVQLPPAPYGEWQIVVKGSARIGDQEIKPYSMRYIVGPGQPSPFIAGSEGATWLLLTFDQAAEKSGAYPESSPDLVKSGGSRG